MPGKVKLLNAAAAGTTGAWYRIGTGPPPITIRTSGGYTFATGAGVSIEISSAPELFAGSTATPTTEPPEIPMGVVGGGSTDATTANLTVLADKTVASMPYYPATFIRAKVDAAVVGAATVFMEFPR